MIETVIIDQGASWRDVAVVAKGARLQLADAAWARIAAARDIVEALVSKGVRGYGINTGVGALCDVIVDRDRQQALSRNILLSHSCGVGEPLGREKTRAVMAAQIVNFSHGFSGIRVETVEALLALLNADILPVIPSRGSVGYLTHAAAIGLVLIGEGEAMRGDERLSGRHALAAVGLAPLVPLAKEGLSLVNGTPCATGLACLALSHMENLLDWADAAAAMSYENLGAQSDPFAAAPLLCAFPRAFRLWETISAIFWLKAPCWRARRGRARRTRSVFVPCRKSMAPFVTASCRSVRW